MAPKINRPIRSTNDVATLSLMMAFATVFIRFSECVRFRFRIGSSMPYGRFLSTTPFRIHYFFAFNGGYLQIFGSTQNQFSAVCGRL